MSDQAFLSMVVARAQQIAELEKRGRTFNARRERHALDRDIHTQYWNDYPNVALCQKLVMNEADEKPALPPPQPCKRRPRIKRGR